MDAAAQILITVDPSRVWSKLGDPAERRRLNSALPADLLAGAVGGAGTGLLRGAWQGSALEIAVTGEQQQGMPPATFTRVSVRHTSIPEGVLPAAFYQKESWKCVWALWLRNLKALCEREELPASFQYGATLPPVVERSLEMDATPARIWQALVSPDQRRTWMGDELGEELGREEGRSISFAFRLEPVPSRVTWTLLPLDGGARTQVLLRHEGLTRALFDHQLGWHDYLVSLYQATARPLIRSSDWIGAPPDRVWRFLSTQEGMRRWWNPEMTFEPRLGGKVFFRAHGGELGGKVVAFEANRKLAFSWTEYGEGWPEPEPLLLTLELQPENGGTRVTLTHSGFENLPEGLQTPNWAGYQRGWAKRASILSLRTAVEQVA